MEERLARPDVEAWIVEEAGEPVGYLQVHPEGLDMFLVPAARGRGLGPDAARAMAEHLLDERGWRASRSTPTSGTRARSRVGARRLREVSSHEADDEHTAPWSSWSSAASRPPDRRRRPVSVLGSGTGDSSISSLRSSSRGVYPLRHEGRVPDNPSSNFPRAQPDSTRRARSARSSPSRPCSSARTGTCRTSACRSRTGSDPAPDHARHDDPDALAVLRHSTAHLLAEAVRRSTPA